MIDCVSIHKPSEHNFAVIAPHVHAACTAMQETESAQQTKSHAHVGLLFEDRFLNDAGKGTLRLTGKRGRGGSWVFSCCFFFAPKDSRVTKSFLVRLNIKKVGPKGLGGVGGREVHDGNNLFSEHYWVSVASDQFFLTFLQILLFSCCAALSGRSIFV